MIVQVASAAIAVLAALIALLQVRTMRKVSDAERVYELTVSMTTEQARNARQELYGLAGRALSEWSDDEYAVAERVCLDFDRLGLMLRESYAPGRSVMSWTQGTVERCFRIARPLIEYRRASEGNPLIFVDFEWLARREHVSARAGRDRRREREWRRLVARSKEMDEIHTQFVSSRRQRAQEQPTAKPALGQGDDD